MTDRENIAEQLDALKQGVAAFIDKVMMLAFDDKLTDTQRLSAVMIATQPLVELVSPEVIPPTRS